MIQLDIGSTVESHSLGTGVLGLDLGDTVSARIVYDSAAVDTNPSANIGDYGAPVSAVVTMGTYVFRYGPTTFGSIRVLNDIIVGDDFSVVLTNLVDDTGTYTARFAWFIRDRTSAGEDAIGDDSLPTSFDLTDWESEKSFGLTSLNFNSDAHSYSTITSFSTTTVPEPGTFAMVSAGMVGLCVSRQCSGGIPADVSEIPRVHAVQRC